MIVYRELSSLCQDLGYSARALYTLSNTVTEHYHDVSIPKANGEYRLLHVPDVLCVEPENEGFKAGKEWASEEIKRISHSI